MTFADNLEIRCRSNVFHDGENNCWSLVNPTGIIVSGVDWKPELCKTERTSEAGFLLYEHLKYAPPFRYAIVGWEVDGFRESSEFDVNDLQNLDGLVLSQEFCERLDCFSTFEPFAPKYYWRPYHGEKWQPVD
ncbi:MAG: hypothetical protein H0X72_02500 [Acidobacteria bacterium]|nr:hypothetical protein [Acidobacteriota bacterium]